MVDTTNNTAGNDEEQINPQSILEKRLAEINARKNEDQPQSAEEANTTDNVISGAVAMHEVILPDPIVPITGEFTTEPAAEPDQAEATESNANETVQPQAAVSVPDSTGNVTAETTIVSENNTGESATSTSEAVTSPDAMSTAGVITDPLGMNTEEVTTSNPEAATSVVPVPATSIPEENSAALAKDIPLEDEHHEELLPETDYSTLSTEELRHQLRQVLKNASRQQSREIFELYRTYETKLAEDRHEALNRFVGEGGAADDFEYRPGAEHAEVERAFQQFRELRSREQRQDEEQKVKNAQRKQELLDQLRELVESPETKSSGDKIKQIQSEWKALGPVPAAESKQLWNSYHALLDIFYNNRSIFYELKELDRRRNLQHKLQLCERAESLIEQPSINQALQELRNLHEEWKHVGPVPNEHRDSIWERFIQASEKIHARKKEFISARKSVEQENLVKKSELLFRMEPYQSFQTDRINDWRDKTDEIQKLKEEWDAIGLVPKERADEINKRFWSSYKAFFNHKNAFFKNLDEQKMQNLRLKTELCEQAESLKDSTDWDETKEKLIQLQKKWKTIGRVPDKYSEKLWQRFRAACNEFFDRKQNQVTQREAELNQASNVKNSYYEQLATRMTTINTDPGTVAEFEQLRDNYLALPVTKFSGKTDDRYFDLLQKYVASITDLSTDEKDNLAAQLQVTRLKNGPDAHNRIHQKEQAIKRDIGQLENDIRTLKTNIEFFGRSKNAEKLREEYNSRIAEADHRIQQLQRQLYLIRNA